MQKWRWYHGVLFYLGVEAAAFGLAQLAKRGATQGVKQEQAAAAVNNKNEYDTFYESLTLPVFAPPAPVFLPAWAVNNVLTISGLLRVLNLPADTPGRRAYLQSLGVFYVSYVGFTGIYFSLRSPIGGALLTDVGLVAALRCGYIALYELDDKKVAGSLSTLVPWLVLAATTSTTVAAWNPDALFGTAPLVKPSPRWRKK